MLLFAQLVKEWRSKTYEYLPHFFKLQARERLLIHRNNICIMKKLRLTQISVSTSLHRLSSRLPRELFVNLFQLILGEGGPNLT